VLIFFFYVAKENVLSIVYLRVYRILHKLCHIASV